MIAEGVHVELAPIPTPATREREHTAARKLVRELLREIVGPEVAASPIATRHGGAPFLAAHPDIGISMSHSGDWVAAAVGVGRAVGIDIQVPQSTPPGLLRRCCAPAVRMALMRMPAARRDLEFARLWTAQEACVKATGAGLAGLPWTIPVDIGQLDGDWHGVRWLALRGLPVPASCAYVAKEAARC
jgi:4'-phosphopantetheinyl transferase